jgi:hypothetical protein
MAQQPYMGSGLLLPPLYEVTKSCEFVAVGDWPTGRATILSILMCPPEPSGSQWEMEAFNLAYVTFLFMPVRFFWPTVLRIFITLKNLSPSVGIEPANLGSSGEHANH